ncbi:MAG: hypothetical protein JO154_25265 [Chitinophaga sp.]|uniref:hypothetical protein n=1 Tax=Chitinophaga sp. TaxID=1869181 RepID=UPI0025BE97B8|nr:hypothetical protein [Chitinophaga sp.]MBV8255930.1 hypothetical protein [Chitinophaga sp.]
MKKTILLIGLLIAGVSIQRSFAQVSVNINIGSQPLWGPTGYDYVQYYYLPDVDAYYNVANRQFIYMDRDRWVYGSALPGYYQCDLDRCYKVVVNDPNPWMRGDYYRNRYVQYRGYYDRQRIIRNTNDVRYVQVHRWNDRRDDRRYYSDNDNRWNNGGTSWRVNHDRDNGWRDNGRDNNWNQNRGNGRDNNWNNGNGRDNWNNQNGGNGRDNNWRGNDNRGDNGHWRDHR